MRSIKINEKQAKMLKEMGTIVQKGKVVKISEEQYNKIKDMSPQYTEYNGVEIMYEPHYNEWYVGDVPVKDMEAAKRFIDGGGDGHVPIPYHRDKDFNEGQEVGGLPVPREQSFREMPTNEISTSQKPSNKITKNFSNGLDKNVKKQMDSLYEEFINELYGLNEEGHSKYEKLRSLMEVAGLIENGRLKKSKFGGNKEVVKSVLGRGLYEMANGRTHYSVMETIEKMLKENGGYPAGAANDPSAPYNQNQKMSKPSRAKEQHVKLVWFDDEDALFTGEGGKFILSIEKFDRQVFEPYVEREETDNYKDEEGDYYTEYSDDWEIDGNAVEQFTNDNYNDLTKGVGVDAFESEDIELVQIDAELGNYLIEYFRTHDDKLKQFLLSMEETTTASSSGAFVAPLTGGEKFSSNLPDELDETTTTTSAGGSSGSFAYDAPAGDGNPFWTKGNKQNKTMNESEEQRYVAEMDFFVWAHSNEEAKQMAYSIAKQIDDHHDNRAKIQNIYFKPFGHIGTPEPIAEDAKKDTQWPNGEFVELDKCTTLNNNKVAQNGGCSQGAVDNVVKTKKSKNSVISKSSISEGMMREALKLQHDKEKNRLIVISDLEGKAASRETFTNKNVLKKNGFSWTGQFWAIDADKLEVAKQTLSLVNKAEYLINSLEDLEVAVAGSSADNKDLLTARLDQYIMDLANATDEVALSAEIRRYLTFFSKFHNYSFHNRILIYIQKPDATRVASYGKWKEKHRQVKKGAKSITVLAPIIRKGAPEIDTSGYEDVPGIQNLLDKNKGRQQVSGYKGVRVFDISDTEPMDERGEIPDTPEWHSNNEPSETADILYGAISEVASDMGVKVTNEPTQSGEKGYSAGDHINISSDVEGVGRLATMIHEMAHELMHRKDKSIYYIDNGMGDTRALKELQAESVSYVVLKHYNLPAKHHATYLALWKANKDKIQNNLKIISKVSQFIIEKIDAEVTRGEKNANFTEK